MNAVLRPNVRVMLALLLIGLQAALVVAGLFWPRANPAYSATYITHSRDCWLPPGTPAFLPSGDVIVPRALSALQACALLPKGWNPADTTNVWSAGERAEIDLPLRPDDRWVTLQLMGYSQSNAQSVKILPPGMAPLNLSIPPGTIATAQIPVTPGQGMLRFQLRIAHIHHPLDPDFSDWREIGVALLAITRSKDPAPAAP